MGFKQGELNDYANQFNPKHDGYWQSRGFDQGPDDDDDEDGDNSSELAEDVWGDDNESFEEEWMPQEAW